MGLCILSWIFVSGCRERRLLGWNGEFMVVRDQLTFAAVTPRPEGDSEV